MLVVVLVLENPDRFAIRLTEQIRIGLFAVTESQCTEDEHDDEDDSKFRNLGLTSRQRGDAPALLLGQRPQRLFSRCAPSQNSQQRCYTNLRLGALVACRAGILGCATLY